jgi:Ca2+-binding EF-hand superfamily protein
MHVLTPNLKRARRLRVLPLLAAASISLGALVAAPSAFANDEVAAAGSGLPDQAKHWDQNGDGALDADEKAELRANLLEAWDADGDGRLNRAERDAARAAGELPSKPDSRKWKRATSERRKAIERAEKLEPLDTDKDGSVSKEEIWSAATAGERDRAIAKRKAALERYDADGDGKLDEDERRKARLENGLVRRDEIAPPPDANKAAQPN